MKTSQREEEEAGEGGGVGETDEGSGQKKHGGLVCPPDPDEHPRQIFCEWGNVLGGFASHLLKLLKSLERQERGGERREEGGWLTHDVIRDEHFK